MSMWQPLLVGLAASAVMSWRLITVVVISTDEVHRRDAIRLCGYIWTGGTAGTGAVTALIKAHELGIV